MQYTYHCTTIWSQAAKFLSRIDVSKQSYIFGKHEKNMLLRNTNLQMKKDTYTLGWSVEFFF